jgi:hypothetical protein
MSLSLIARSTTRKLVVQVKTAAKTFTFTPNRPAASLRCFVGDNVDTRVNGGDMMRTDQSRINVRRAAIIFVAGIITASCSEKPAADRENDASEALRESEMESKELRPGEDKIVDDCVAFVQSTKAVPARGASADCPRCPAGGTELLALRQTKTDSVSCSNDTCTVLVTIRAVFNPGSGVTIAGGLTAWIPPEQRRASLSGQTPSGEQEYHVQITYKRRGTEWRAVEFDRAPAK